MPVPVAEIAALLFGRSVGFNATQSISLESIVYDSRKVQPGSVFVAVPGAKGDGHAFVASAQAQGASCCIVEHAEALGAGAGFVVPDSRRALSALAALGQGYPARELSVFAVTGTNGKTTIHWLLAHSLQALGIGTLRIGTLGVEAPGIISRPGEMTTPDALQIQADMRLCVSKGVRACVMEASSHALAQHRVDDIAFDVAIFTNLTRDHLDYHGDMDSYYRAKRRLFELSCESPKSAPAAVLNVDDSAGQRLALEFRDSDLRLFLYGESKAANVRIVGFEHSISGSLLQLKHAGHELGLRTPFIGKHNAQNLAAVFASLLAQGVSEIDAVRAIESCPQVPGRLESVGNESVGVFVDYAHTPDALANVLAALRPLVKGSLWVVFGCGGDRDKGKRPQMGKVAESLADKVVVTSDNPRTEVPEAIIDDILASGVKAELVNPDRRSAIRQTIMQAAPGDIVLIAGKGHEDYQVLGTEKIHFSDQEEARCVLRELLRGG